MFKKFTPKGIFATCFLFSLFAVCVWNFPINNYDVKDFYKIEQEPYWYRKQQAKVKTEQLKEIYKGKRHKNYRELLLYEMMLTQTEAKDRLEFDKELLSINMEHNPDIIISIIDDYIELGMYEEALDVAKNTKLAKNSCFKESKTLGEAIACRTNVHYFSFVQAWYANEISCKIMKSACLDSPRYEQFKEDKDFYYDNQDLIERALDIETVKQQIQIRKNFEKREEEYHKKFLEKLQERRKLKGITPKPIM